MTQPLPPDEPSPNGRPARPAQEYSPAEARTLVAPLLGLDEPGDLMVYVLVGVNRANEMAFATNLPGSDMALEFLGRSVTEIAQYGRVTRSEMPPER